MSKLYLPVKLKRPVTCTFAPWLHYHHNFFRGFVDAFGPSYYNREEKGQKGALKWSLAHTLRRPSQAKVYGVYIIVSFSNLELSQESLSTNEKKILYVYSCPFLLVFSLVSVSPSYLLYVDEVTQRTNDMWNGWF